MTQLSLDELNYMSLFIKLKDSSDKALVDTMA